MSKSYDSLTSLRGLAAVWVVANHAMPLWTPRLAGLFGTIVRSGYMAVDVFFILSGFILADVYRKLATRDAPLFWYRRILRIYPLHFVTMCLIGLMALLGSPYGPSHLHPWREFLPVTLLIQSYLLTDTPWNPPSWSLSIELACYFLFPFMMPILSRAPAWLMPLACVVLGIAEALVVTRFNGVTTGLGALARGIAGFGLGAVLSRLPCPRAAWKATFGQSAAVVAVIACILVHSASGVAVGAALLILTLRAESGHVARQMARPVWLWLGKISFSIYLLHAPVIALITYHMPLPPDPWLRVAVLLTVLLPLSTLSYRAIEKPARRLGYRSAATTF